MFNKSFSAESVLSEICSPGFNLVNGCLRHSCGFRFVNQ